MSSSRSRSSSRGGQEPPEGNMDNLDNENNNDEDREDETVDEKIDRLGREVEDLLEQVERMLDTLPPITRPPVPEPLIKLRHAIKEKHTERELLIEDQRSSKVVEDYLQENPSILEKVDECPICLDPLFDVEGAAICGCCGKRMCICCSAALHARATDTCPLCRRKFPPPSDQLPILRTKAAEGKAWAQTSLGQRYYHGSLGLAVDRVTAEALYCQAADQGDSKAQYRLSRLESDRNNASGECRLLEAAASQGHMVALGLLGMLYGNGRGVERDREKAARLLTVSAKLQRSNHSVHACLGWCFVTGEGGLEPSALIATHYLKPAIEGSNRIAHQTVGFFAWCLLKVSSVLYPDQPIPPSGYSIVPEALFWYRRREDVETLSAEAVKFVESYESKVKERCACCYEPLSTNRPKCCVECKAVYYCSQECQVADWKKGHKKDCVRSLKKRLRATGKFDDL